MNARILPDSAYVNGAIIPATYFQALDTAQYQAINGDRGGTWSPSTAITIAGAGMAAQGPWSLGRSPALEVPSGSSLRITHGDSDWVELGSGHAAATRAIYTALGPAADTSFWQSTPAPYGTGVWTALSSRVVGNFAVPSPANGFVYEVTSISGSGTSAASPPTWPTTIGATVTDNPGGNQIVLDMLRACGCRAATPRVRLGIARGTGGASHRRRRRRSAHDAAPGA